MVYHFRRAILLFFLVSHRNFLAIRMAYIHSWMYHRAQTCNTGYRYGLRFRPKFQLMESVWHFFLSFAAERQFSHILGSLLENGTDGCVFIGMVDFPMKLDGFVPLLLACTSWETFKVPWTFPFSGFFGDLMASDTWLQFESAEFICVCFDVVGFDTWNNYFAWSSWICYQWQQFWGDKHDTSHKAFLIEGGSGSDHWLTFCFP